MEANKASEVDVSEGLYGDMAMIRSEAKVDRTLTRVGDITADKDEQTVWVRGRLFTSRLKGKEDGALY